MITTIKEYSKCITEGLIKSYDINIIQKSINNLSKLDEITLKFEKDKISNNKFSLIFNNPKIYDIIKILEYCINLYGYFPTKYKAILNNVYKNTIDGNWNIDRIKNKLENNEILELIIKFESKFTSKITNINIFYHWTPTKNINKILNNGLYPKSENKLQNHRDRVYLFSDFNKKDTLLHKFKNLDKHKEYTLLKIDLTNSNIIIQEDPEYKDGFFSVEPISKEYITIY